MLREHEPAAERRPTDNENRKEMKWFVWSAPQNKELILKDTSCYSFATIAQSDSNCANSLCF